MTNHQPEHLGSTARVTVILLEHYVLFVISTWSAPWTSSQQTAAAAPARLPGNGVIFWRFGFLQRSTSPLPLSASTVGIIRIEDLAASPTNDHPLQSQQLACQDELLKMLIWRQHGTAENLAPAASAADKWENCEMTKRFVRSSPPALAQLKRAASDPALAELIGGQFRSHRYSDKDYAAIQPMARNDILDSNG